MWVKPKMWKTPSTWARKGSVSHYSLTVHDVASTYQQPILAISKNPTSMAESHTPLSRPQPRQILPSLLPCHLSRPVLFRLVLPRLSRLVFHPSETTEAT